MPDIATALPRELLDRLMRRQALTGMASKAASVASPALAAVGAGQAGWGTGRKLGGTPLISDSGMTYDQFYEDLFTKLLAEKAVTLEQQKPVVTNFPQEQPGAMTTTLPQQDTTLPQERFLPSDLTSKTPPFMPIDDELTRLLSQRQGMYVGETDPSVPGTFSSLTDRKMRREISDKEANLIPYDLTDTNPKQFYNLEEVYNHPKLYDKYPELRKQEIRFAPEENYESGLGMGQQGAYSPTDKTINITRQLMYREPVEKTIAHELQHVIQEKEGWAKGGSPSDFVDPKENYSKIADKANEKFENFNRLQVALRKMNDNNLDKVEVEIISHPRKKFMENRRRELHDLLEKQAMKNSKNKAGSQEIRNKILDFVTKRLGII
jgi:hypothetical protein